MLNQYRIYYWEDGCKYCMVIGTNNEKNLWDSLKKRYNRFTMEAI